tara:strand:- start:494 stop:640 length:147 start_codon:yes stop_codon:yes gene_type:complete
MNNEEKQNIVKFIQDVNQKNYAEAHKYLKDSLDQKMKQRIANTLQQEQ